MHVVLGLRFLSLPLHVHVLLAFAVQGQQTATNTLRNQTGVEQLLVGGLARLRAELGNGQGDVPVGVAIGSETIRWHT